MMADDVSLAMQYMRENKPRDAESLLNRILKHDPNDLNA
jgi:Tfp pilus assembly protein PilF